MLHLSSLTNGAADGAGLPRTWRKRPGSSWQISGPAARTCGSPTPILQAQPRRYNSSPLWSGLMDEGRAYAAFTYNVDRLVPWRTLTGRQHFYLDHEVYLAFAEHLPTYKPSPRPELYGDLKETLGGNSARVLNCLTPHGKWHIHSTYMDNLQDAHPCPGAVTRAG